MIKVARVVSDLSLSSVPSLLESGRDALGLSPKDMYSVFTFEQIHNLHLVISELLKTVT